MTSIDLALVSKAGPLQYSHDDDDDAVDGTNHSNNSVTSIYEAYASLYPNIQLNEERLERDRLLCAISAASEATELNPKKSERGGGGGFFSFLFGSRQKQPQKDSLSSPINNDDDDDDDRIEYIPQQEQDSLFFQDDNLLCGTTASLDPTCIPPEAHAMARFHLSSIRSHIPNVARTAWERAGTTLLTVLALGVLSEYREQQQQSSSSSCPTLQYTSDRHDLLKAATAATTNTPYNIAYARSALLGPNLLAVSWGLPNGIVVLYRRLRAGHQEVQWQAVAHMTPTPMVVEQCEGDGADDNDNDEQHNQNNDLYRVTGLLPIVVEQMERIPSATLAISRLSGHIELWPLPHAKWYGPELDVPPQPGSGTRLRVDPPLLVVWSTHDYHQDVVSMDVLRTTVEDDDTWDQHAYPQGPPSEHVLALSGTTQEGHQVVSFWSVSTLYGQQQQQEQQQHNNKHDNTAIGFSLVARLLEAMDTGTAGPDITIFATPEILRYWRRPRQLQLKVEQNNDETAAAAADLPTHRVTSISVPAPIVSMRFLSQEDCFRLALLDWNGGVTVLDCDLLERTAAQRLTVEEYAQVHQGDDAATVTALAVQLNHRMSTREQVDGNIISSIEWPSRVLCGPTEPLLAVVTSQPNTLSLVSPFHEATRPAPITIALPRELSTRLHRYQNKGILGLVSTRQRLHRRELSFAALHRMDPTEIVRSLAREGQYQAAIDAAAASSSSSSSSPRAVSSVVAECQRHLWESTHQDIATLQNMTDDQYIVQQALEFSSFPFSDHDDSALRNFGQVHRLAWERLTKASKRLGASIVAGGGLEGTDDLLRQVRERWIQLGTYQLLCRHFGTEPRWTHFAKDILPLSARELAQSLARASDIAATSLVCVRHACDWREILQDIPLTLPVECYRHLLPMARGKGWFLDNQGNVMDATHIAGFLSSFFNLDCMLDAQDEQIIREHAEETAAESDERIRSLEAWYLSRAESIQAFLGSIPSVLSFTETALVALDWKQGHTALSPEGDQLTSLNARYRLLWEFIEEQEGVNVSQIAQLEHMEDLELAELVGIVMDGYVDGLEIYQRYKRFFLPFAQQRLADADGSLDDEVATAISFYCSRLIKGSTDAGALRIAVSMCSSFLSLSRTDKNRETRIIKDKEVLMRLVIMSVELVVERCSQLELESADCRHILTGLWSFYECSPVAAMGKDGFSSSYESLSMQLDQVYRNLVVLDVLYRWEGSKGFVVTWTRMQASAIELPSVDEGILLSLCRSFCEQVGWMRDGKRFDGEDLLSDMLQDVDDLNRLSFLDSFSVKDALARDLLAPLLRQRQIRLVGSSLSLMKAAWVDLDCLSSEMTDFVQNAVFAPADSSSSSNLYAAIECQDVLGKFFPELTELFQDVRRCLDSADFINSVLLSNVVEGFITPASLRRQPPLDVIDFLLARDPMLSVHDNTEWGEDAWSLTANRSIRSCLQKQSHPSPNDEIPVPPPPSPPGRAMLHLAHLLGLTEVGKLDVRQKLVDACIESELYGAASAICRTFFIDLSPFKELPALLNSIAEIVCAVEYKDIETKRELCALVLRNYGGYLSISSSKAYDRIVASYSEMETAALSASPPKSSPLHSFQRLCQDTKGEYSMSLAELFATLIGQTLSDSVDDELLNALARYAIYWCIAQSTRPKLGGPSAFDDVCITSNLSLASSLLLHIQNEDLKKECCTQTNSIFHAEQTAALNLQIPELASEFVRPNEDIVARLVHRGYNEFGAQRAAVMSQNAGYDEALQWAIMHCLDLGFEEPLLHIRKANEVDINRVAIGYMKHVMQELQSLVVHQSSRLAFPPPAVPSSPKQTGVNKLGLLKHSGTSASPKSKTGKSNSGASLLKGRIDGNASILPEMGPIESPRYKKGRDPLSELGSSGKKELEKVARSLETSLPANEGKSTRMPEQPKPPKMGNNQNGAHLPIASLKPKSAAPSLDATNKRVTGMVDVAPQQEQRTTKPAPAPPAPKQLVVENGSTPAHQTVQNPPNKATPRPPAPPSSLPPSIQKNLSTPRASPPINTPAPRPKPPTPRLLSPDSRNRMKEQGQAVLRSIKKSSPSAADPNRSRLIAEGRRLLLKARSSPPKLAKNGPVPPPRPPPGPPPSKTNGKSSTSSNGNGWDFDEDDFGA